MCVVAAFGVTFAYPIVIPWLRATHPSAMPTVHASQARIGRRLIGPVSTLVLLTGIYLATDRNLWDQAWVTVPFVIIIILFGLARRVLHTARPPPRRARGARPGRRPRRDARR